MSQIDIVWDDSDLQKFIHHDFPDLMQKAIKETAFALTAEIKKEAPVDEGRLQGSYNVRQAGSLSWAIVSNADYRWIVHEGRGAIRPRKAKALRIDLGTKGGVIFRRYAGPAKGNPFIDRAIDNMQPRIPDIIARAMEGGGY